MGGQRDRQETGLHTEHQIGWPLDPDLSSRLMVRNEFVCQYLDIGAWAEYGTEASQVKEIGMVSHFHKAYILLNRQVSNNFFHITSWNNDFIEIISSTENKGVRKKKRKNKPPTHKRLWPSWGWRWRWRSISGCDLEAPPDSAEWWLLISHTFRSK